MQLSQTIKATPCSHPARPSAQSRSSRSPEICKRRSIIAASVDGTVRCFDLRAGACYTDELGHPVASMALSHDGNCLLAACLDSRVRLLDRESGELLATYQGEVFVRPVVTPGRYSRTPAEVVGWTFDQPSWLAGWQRCLYLSSWDLVGAYDSWSGGLFYVRQAVKLRAGESWEAAGNLVQA